MGNRWWAAPGAAAAVALLAACGSSGAATGGGSGGSGASSSSSSSAVTTASTSASGIKTAKAAGGTILETAQGFAVYWFAIDTPTKSNCSGQCVSFWPPLTGKATMAAGTSLPGKFGTIKRSDGTTQPTYDGHPLYLFKEDTAPGQVHGNKINTSGGLWWVVTPSGAKLTAAPTPTKSSGSGGGGGYGY
jgi:predicted lipoprotein with Yx(FWY)xxD motif